ncbi:response regulator, partial [Klebsiella pneumoniae]|uniref:response regulator n=1 Tax=Klebsiella pneumoniae TaxID=573 RepID=UPI001BCE4F67
GYLISQCGYAVAHSATNAEECFERVEIDGPPALLVVDFWLPQGTAIDLLRQAMVRAPGCRLLVMSGDEDQRVQIKAKEAGAHGFIRKAEPPEVFAQAVDTLRQGGNWFRLSSGTSLTPARRELPLSLR